MQNKPSQLAFRVICNLLPGCRGVDFDLRPRGGHTVPDPVVIGKISYFKGLAFVAVTALLLYFTLRNQMRAGNSRLAHGCSPRIHFRQLSQAVEQSPVSVIITDTKGNIEYVNRKFRNRLVTPWKKSSPRIAAF